MGPLKGIKVIEMAGLGPTPFAGMLLADMGAEVILLERKNDANNPHLIDPNRRGKYSIIIDLKNQEEIELVLKLVEKADVLMEGFRPGVMERLGLGSEILHKRNPKLIIGRMTGWGQNGPLAQRAGHDINYISLTGALRGIGKSGQAPSIPLNLVGDYGGGSMFLLTGILAALLEVQKSGLGQVIDASITDGSALLMSLFHSMHNMRQWSTTQGTNLLDGGAPYYDVYETKDGKFISIGAIEPQFYTLLCEKLELPEKFKSQNDVTQWAAFKKELSAVFKTKTRQEWTDLLEGTDTCFAPVLDFLEAQNHPHHIARKTYLEVDGYAQPAPAPRFSRTQSTVRFGSRKPGSDAENVLREWGIIEKKN